MTKFKKIAARHRAGDDPAPDPAPILSRRHAMTGLAALALAAPLLPARPARAGRPPLDGPLAEAFAWLEAPRPVPEAPFATAEGGEVTLAAFQGQVVLLNFWATWCAPCIREMPSLDRLQAALRDEGLEVAAVSQDFGGLKVVAPFFERLALDNLTVYLDSNGALGKAFGISGLPTTLLIDRQGRLVGGLEGPAEWDSDEAVALIRHYLEEPSAA